MNDWAQIVVAIVALGGPFLAYLVAARKTSGRIRSSDASELWEESSAIRRECAERVRILEARVKELEGMNMDLQTQLWRSQRAEFGDHA